MYEEFQQGYHIEYPKTMASSGRNGLVLSMDSNLRAMENEDLANGKSPLTTFKPWASLTLNFANSEKKTGGAGNIEITRIADVKLRTQIAMQAVMEKECGKGRDTGKNTAAALLETKVYYLPGKMRELKGLSAMEIADKAGSAGAMEAAGNLEESANKSPRYAEANLKQAGALRFAAMIADAKLVTLPDGRTLSEIFDDLDAAGRVVGQLYQSGSPAFGVANALLEAIRKDPSVSEVLKNGWSSETRIYKIYGPILKTPNTKKVDAQGYTAAYQLSIICNPDRTEYPFHVELVTMRGKPLANADVGVDGKTIIGRQTFEIDLASWEWVGMIERADWEKRMVELMFHNQAYQTMVKVDDANYQRRKQEAGNQQGIPPLPPAGAYRANRNLSQPVPGPGFGQAQGRYRQITVPQGQRYGT